MDTYIENQKDHDITKYDSFRNLKSLHLLIKTYTNLTDRIVSNSDKLKNQVHYELKIKHKIIKIRSQYLLLRNLIMIDFLRNISAINDWLKTIVDLSDRYKMIQSYESTSCTASWCALSWLNIKIDLNHGFNMVIRRDTVPNINEGIDRARMNIINTLNMFNSLHMNKLFIIQSIWQSIRDDINEIRDYYSIDMDTDLTPHKINVIF